MTSFEHIAAAVHDLHVVAAVARIEHLRRDGISGRELDRAAATELIAIIESGGNDDRTPTP